MVHLIKNWSATSQLLQQRSGRFHSWGQTSWSGAQYLLDCKNIYFDTFLEVSELFTYKLRAKPMNSTWSYVTVFSETRLAPRNERWCKGVMQRTGWSVQLTVVLVKTRLIYRLSVYHSRSAAFHLPRFSIPENSSISSPSKSAECESICQASKRQTQTHTPHKLSARENERGANDGTGGDGMMVEVKGWHTKGRGGALVIDSSGWGWNIRENRRWTKEERVRRCVSKDTEGEMEMKTCQKMLSYREREREIWEIVALQKWWNVAARGRLKE